MSEIKGETQECKKTIRAVHDAMDVLNGKWRISIIATLKYNPKRYSDILADIKGLSGKMLSRELKDMEINELIKRTVVHSKPISVVYELTEYGHKLDPVLESLAEWGIEHRSKLLKRL